MFSTFGTGHGKKGNASLLSRCYFNCFQTVYPVYTVRTYGVFTGLIGRGRSGRGGPAPRPKRKRPKRTEGIAFAEGAEGAAHRPSSAPYIGLPFLVALSWPKCRGVHRVPYGVKSCPCCAYFRSLVCSHIQRADSALDALI